MHKLCSALSYVLLSPFLFLLLVLMLQVLYECFKISIEYIPVRESMDGEVLIAPTNMFGRVKYSFTRYRNKYNQIERLHRKIKRGEYSMFVYLKDKNTILSQNLDGKNAIDVATKNLKDLEESQEPNDFVSKFFFHHFDHLSVEEARKMQIDRLKVLIIYMNKVVGNPETIKLDDNMIEMIKLSKLPDHITKVLFT